MNIDPRAIVSPHAQLGDDVTIGPNSIIEDDVVIGSGTIIAANALIANGARIGKECRIHHGAVVASPPQDLKFRGEPSIMEIGDHTTLREYVTANRGTGDQGKTSIGHHCFIMAYAHIAHDCSVGNHVILANSVNMAGHVIIDDHAVIGGIVAIHQFCHVGRNTMIGGGFRVVKDVPPYILAGHEPLTYQGLNVVGLRRKNFTPEEIATIEKAYMAIYHEQLNVTQAVAKIRATLPMTDEILRIIDFIEHSKRGIIWNHK